jgi:hypothetical protein
MSLLPSGTYASPLNPYYSNGGGGGGGSSNVSSLVSPTILTETDGQAIMILGGDTTSLRMRNIEGSVEFQPIPLQVGVLPFINYVASSHFMSIGDAVDGGAVTVRNPLLIDAPGTGVNFLEITPTSATESIICQNAPTSGAILIGSSLAQQSTLTIYDIGANTGKVEVGGNGGIPLRLQGGSVASPTCIITADAGVNGSLSIGSSQAAPNQLVLTDASGVFFGSSNAPIYTSAVATQALPFLPAGYGAGTFAMTMVGLPDGMYIGMVKPGGAGPTDPSTLGSCFTFQFYVKAGLCVYGGVSSNTAGNVFTQPASGLASISFINSSGANIYIEVIFSRITGALPGF